MHRPGQGGGGQGPVVQRSIRPRQPQPAQGAAASQQQHQQGIGTLARLLPPGQAESGHFLAVLLCQVNHFVGGLHLSIVALHLGGGQGAHCA